MKRKLLIIICICLSFVSIYVLKKRGGKNYIIYKNAYITYDDGKKIYFYSDGTFYDYDFESPKKLSNCIGDIRIKDNKVVYVGIKREFIEALLVSFDNDYMCVEGYGNLNMTKDIKLYDNPVSVKNIEFENLLAHKKYKFFIENDKICAVISDFEPKEEIKNIRVLIKTSGYESIFHNSIEISSDSDIRINGENKNIRDYIIDCDKIGEGEIVNIDSDSGIMLNNIARSEDKIVYKGMLNIIKCAGGLVLVNELPIEEYLRLVVPSEMPQNYNIEAIKAQAVCARTYAYKHILNPSYVRYGADLDDSDSYQVYGNHKGNNITDKAIYDTKGQVLSFKDGLVDTNYYSTSCGYGADMCIWGENLYNEAVIPRTINCSEDVYDLKENHAFYEFISKENTEDYDYNYPYYRWKGEILCDGIKECANVGEIKSINVTKRLACGVADELTIIGDKGKNVIYNQYEIRKFLGKCGFDISNKNGKINLNMLPSGFFYIEYKDGTCVVSGGGLGHGVGMSQNAANEMGHQGKKYDDILHYFFKKCDITRAY